jgi:serine protease Do
MTTSKRWQAALVLAIGLLTAPLYGQAEESDQPGTATEPPARTEQAPSARPKKSLEKQSGQPLLTEKQRSLLGDISSAIHTVANSVEASVVHIEVTDIAKPTHGRVAPSGRGGNRGGDNEDSEQSQVPDDLREQLRKFFGGQMPPGMENGDEPSQPERVRRGLGSGIVYDKQGHILTNNHVVGGAERIRVLTTDGREFSAEIVGADPLTDVAVIKVKSNELKAAEFGDSTKSEVGDLVLAVGNPFGLDYSVSLGIVSAIGRSGLQLGSIYYQDFIQTDAAINPGNSGGPLVNMNGQVIGLTTAIATQTGQYAGVGFAIPSNLAKKIADILVQKGKVTRGWLGVSIANLKPGIAESFKYPEDKTGVLVDDVVPDSPAAKAGFKAGDIIMQMNGQPVKNATQLQTTVTLTPPNQKVTFQIWRIEEGKSQGRSMDLQATLGELKESYLRGMAGEGPGGAPGAPQKFESEDLGLTAVTPTTEVAKKFGWPETPKGALVVDVNPGGEAASLGIRPGDVIVSVQSQVIESASDLSNALKKVSVAEGFRMRITSPRQGGRYVYVQRG